MCFCITSGYASTDEMNVLLVRHFDFERWTVTFGKLHTEVDMFICVKNSISRTIDEIEHITRYPKLNSQ